MTKIYQRTESKNFKRGLAVQNGVVKVGNVTIDASMLPTDCKVVRSAYVGNQNGPYISVWQTGNKDPWAALYLELSGCLEEQHIAVATSEGINSLSTVPEAGKPWLIARGKIDEVTYAYFIFYEPDTVIYTSDKYNSDYIGWVGARFVQAETHNKVVLLGAIA